MTTNKEAEQLVRDSFLQEKDKAFLIKILETEGAAENFFEKFKALIVEEVKNITEKYKTAILDLNGGFIDADKWFLEQKENLEKETEEKLGKINPTDIKSKNEFWKDYDNKMATLSAEYKKKLDQATSKAALTNIK